MDVTYAAPGNADAHPDGPGDVSKNPFLITHHPQPNLDTVPTAKNQRFKVFSKAPDSPSALARPTIDQVARLKEGIYHI
jgi:hypothetical protein